MGKKPTAKTKSAFADIGLKRTVAGLIEEVQELYCADKIPWVVGYSGGKDSTATLQLVWLALEQLPEEKRTKQVHVISTDTLVENPIVAAWVAKSLEVMAVAARQKELPILPHRLTPTIQDSFWVNLIGRGYPAPRHKFRWCTERMKINPSNKFITDVVRENGEAILVLGTRKAESSKRAANMKRHEKYRVRDRLSPNAALPNSLIYSAIEDWTNDDVWLFLMQTRNPWGYNNKDLLTMYQGASEDGECPLVVDTTTPSCGSSRFGCWVCTLVDKDKSMGAMIQNDEEKEWMLPLLELRNELDIADDRHLRDFRRMSGLVQLYRDRPIPGPYTQKSRAQWLRKLLQAQRWIRDNGPSEVCDIALITREELQEIRRIWVVEKHEMEDLLPHIYEQEIGTPFQAGQLDDGPMFSQEDLQLLESACAGDRLRYELVRELLDVERRFRSKARRSGLFGAIEKAMRKAFYEDAKDATQRARRKRDAKEQAKEGRYVQLSLLAPQQPQKLKKKKKAPTVTEQQN